MEIRNTTVSRSNIVNNHLTTSLKNHVLIAKVHYPLKSLTKSPTFSLYWFCDAIKSCFALEEIAMLSLLQISILAQRIGIC